MKKKLIYCGQFICSSHRNNSNSSKYQKVIDNNIWLFQSIADNSLKCTKRKINFNSTINNKFLDLVEISIRIVWGFPIRNTR